MKNQDGFFGLFFAPIPNLEELIAVKATIQTEKNDEISTIQPMCCRELIFTETKVLVSPLLEERTQLFLITQKAVLHSSQFQELLKKLNIQSTEPVDLTKSLFQFCFSFTMKQKLAPLWNKAGEFLVQGRDFMQEKSKLHSVTLEVTISDKICIGLQAYSLKLTPCKPEHFTASTRALDEFNANTKALISDAAIADDLCFVLPSLKKGRIFSITHQLPDDCPFSNYEDLRKHWKLMYGYRLPSEENVFYNVHFYYIRGKLFTYPASCIRSSQALVSPRCDHQLIFSTFLRDLSCRMPSVCGTPLPFTSSPLYPTNRLQQATHANHSNLTRTAPQLNHCRPFAFQGPRVQDPTRHSDGFPTASFMSSQAESSQIQFQTGCDKNVNQPITTPTVNQARVTPSVNQLKTTPLLDQPRNTPSNPPPYSCLSVGTRFVLSARFTSNRVVTSVSNSSTSGTRIVPTFSKKRVQSRGNEPTDTNSGHRTVLARGSTPNVRAAISRVRLVGNAAQTPNAPPSGSTQPSPRVARWMENASLVHPLSQQTGRQNPANNYMEQAINRTMYGDVRGISSSLSQESMIESPFTNSPAVVHMHASLPELAVSTSTQVSKCLPQKRPGLVITQAAPASGHLAALFTGHVTQRPREDTVHLQEQGSDWGVDSYTPPGRLPIAVPGPREHPNPVHFLQYEASVGFQSSADLTRKRQVSDEDPPHKKPKSKPKIQDRIDVRDLATHDQLHQVNTATLTDWLRKRGVAVKSKDKKVELASKVKHYLAMSHHEQ